MPNTPHQIYLDYAASTPVDPRVLAAMTPYFTEEYGNSEALHTKGQNARVAIDSARETIAKILNCSSNEIIFTSGGTEANNLAILGISRANKHKGKHVITSSIEHSSVRSPFTQLEKEGFEVTYLPVDHEGIIHPEKLEKAIRPDTIFVSLMYANNEIGTIEPIADLGKICRKNGIIFHTDACQAMGAASLDVETLNIDSMTLNASKIYGPKGSGALYIRKGTSIEPIIHGGSHEFGLRGGTRNTPGIVGLAKALELIIAEAEKESPRLSKLRDQLIKGVLQKVPGVKLNGPNPLNTTSAPRLPNNTNFSIQGIYGQDMLLNLDAANIFVSTGAACTVRNSKPSNTLRAIGLPEELIQNSIRVTLGKYTTEEDIDHTIKTLADLTIKLRARK